MKRYYLVLLFLVLGCFSCSNSSVAQIATSTQFLIAGVSTATPSSTPTSIPTNTITPDPSSTSIPSPSIQPSETPCFVAYQVITEVNASDIAIVSELQSSSSKNEIHDLKFSPSGAIVAAADAGGKVLLWRIPKEGSSMALESSELDVFRGNGEAVEAIAFSPDETKIASGGLYAPLSIRDVGNGTPFLTPPSILSVDDLVYFQDGTMLAIAGFDHSKFESRIELWHVGENERLAVLDDYPAWYGSICSLAINFDESVLAAGFCDYQMMTWSLTPEHQPLGKVLGMYSFSCPGHCPFPTNEIEFQPKENILASGTDNPGIPLRDIYAGSLETIINTDRAVVFTDSESGEERLTYSIPDVRDIAFSPDGAVIAIATWYEVQLRNTKTGELLTYFEYSPSSDRYATTIAFSPDGLLIAVGDSQGIIKILGIVE